VYIVFVAEKLEKNGNDEDASATDADAGSDHDCFLHTRRFVCHLISSH